MLILFWPKSRAMCRILRHWCHWNTLQALNPLFPSNCDGFVTPCRFGKRIRNEAESAAKTMFFALT
jgi:hypothetical protein